MDNKQTLNSIDGRIKYCYLVQPYFSHIRLAEDFSMAIGLRYPVVKTIEESDVVILHYEPRCYEDAFSMFPVLRKKYTIGYAVWETDKLPLFSQRGTELLDEVWTTSHYCMDIFKKYHSKVYLIPPVIPRKINSRKKDIDEIRQRINYSNKYYYYMTLSRPSDPRKNVSQLLAAFNIIHRKYNNTRLVLKHNEPTIGEIKQDGVIVINEKFSENLLDALYKVIDCYVSPHHSEGWGVAVADAMLFRKVIIATAYSGSSDFLDDNNSMQIKYRLEKIHSNDTLGELFTTDMIWAYPDQKDFENKMSEVYELSLNEPQRLKKIVNRSYRDACKFSFKNSAGYIYERLDKLTEERMH